MAEALETEPFLAYLQANTGSTEGQQLMNHLGQNYAFLSNHHRGLLKVKRKADGNFVGAWHLTYTSTGNEFRLVLGKGSPLYGTDRGVDILLHCPADSTNEIADFHAVLRVNTQSGILMIEGTNDLHPVQYLLDGEFVQLGAGERHSLWQSVNRFALGKVEFRLTYAQSGQAVMEKLRQARDRVFEGRGLPAPHTLLPVIPPSAMKTHRIGNTLLFGILASGGYCVVRIGINITTGDICAMKSIWTNNAIVRQEIFNEASILLKYPGQTGLLQASFVSCDHGSYLKAGRSGELNATFSACQDADVLNFVTPFATGGDFSTVQLDDKNIRDIMKLLRGPIEGLAFLHDQGYMHRDVTVRNMFIMADGRGVLGEHGKVLKGVGTKCNKIEPSHSRAPEVDGISLYGQAADVWSLGFAIVNIFFKDLYSWPTFDAEKPQSIAWRDESIQKLGQLGQQSTLHRQFTTLVACMLSYDAYNRPTMEQILYRWSVMELIEDDAVENPEIGGPPAKFQKTSRDTKAVRHALAPLNQQAPLMQQPPVIQQAPLMQQVPQAPQIQQAPLVQQVPQIQQATVIRQAPRISQGPTRVIIPPAQLIAQQQLQRQNRAPVGTGSTIQGFTAINAAQRRNSAPQATRKEN